MTPRTRTILIVAGVVLAFTAAAIVYNVRYDPVANLTRVHATELPFDSARVRWWHQAAQCLGIDTTYDAKLRYFVGDMVPKEWGDLTQESKSTTIHAYTDAADHLILFERGFEHDSALTTHEILHDFIKIPGHPARYFGANATRCGILPGTD